jgi:hypothetical protein
VPSFNFIVYVALIYPFPNGSTWVLHKTIRGKMHACVHSVNVDSSVAIADLDSQVILLGSYTCSYLGQNACMYTYSVHVDSRVLTML